MEWSAIKITQYGHGICSRNGKSCHCKPEEHPFAVLEEGDRSGRTDTSRFLVAGAKRSFWIRTKQGMLFEAMPAIREILGSGSSFVIESNSILRFMKPDLYLVVLDLAQSDFKDSARRYLDRAGACLLVNSDAKPEWERVSLKPVLQKPRFTINPPTYMNNEVLQFIRSNQP